VTRFSQRARSIALVKQLGPGLVTGAADDDPSGIATYSQAGAHYGFGLLWTMVLTYPLMSAVQLISARIGRATGAGLASNMAKILPRPILLPLVALLLLANTINIGSDLAAMGDAAQLATGASAHLVTVGFALVSVLLQMFIPYRRYSQFLKWITLTLLAYVAVVLIVRVDWGAAALGLVWPRLEGAGAATTIVAIFGTTISPYLFFWQAAQEVEEIADKKGAKPLVKAPKQAGRELRRIRIDTFSGMAISNLVAVAIIIATAATLNANGQTSIDTAADAARALEPIAGQFAFALFSVGIIGTGLLAVPVLAGSAAFALCDANGWKKGLAYKPWEAVGFYSVIAAATLVGIAIDWLPIEPIKALFWSAVINGVVAVPIMATMIIVASRRKLMGKFVASLRLRVLGWFATAIMAAASIMMLIV
jgi:NRAMP (natural resistance-associated macrophage protein)-like metal ion transporter